MCGQIIHSEMACSCRRKSRQQSRTEAAEVPAETAIIAKQDDTMHQDANSSEIIESLKSRLNAAAATDGINLPQCFLAHM